MDFRFASEDEAFRDESRSFVAAELPQWFGEHAYNDREDSPKEHGEAARAFQRKLAARGWLTLGCEFV